MILQPKIHNNYKLTNPQKKSTLKYGVYGFKAKEYGCLTQKELTTINFLLIKKLRVITNKKNYKFWNKLLLNQNLTKLKTESRMGKGKGTIFTKFIFIKPGNIIFEFDNIDTKTIYSLYTYIKKKFAIKINLITKK